METTWSEKGKAYHHPLLITEMAESVGMKVGEWFAFYVLDKLVSKVFSYFSDRCDLLKGVEDMLQDVEDRLPPIRAVIDAAEGMPVRDQALAKWMAELKDAACAADDVVDEFDTAKIRRKPRKEATAACRETSSFLLADKVFGRDKEIQMMLDLLLSSGEPADGGGTTTCSCAAGSSSGPGLAVLPIIGIGGVGKTTLAQLIYNDPRVAQHFQLRRWVYVSNNFDVKRISKELVHGAIADPRFVDISLDEALVKLTDATRNERFLFVLDDVWDERGIKWKELHSALTLGSKGSTVLVTTQSPVVADLMGTVEPIELKCLGDDDYWELFEHCAFGDDQDQLDGSKRRRLQLIGQEISKKLHGLPLAGKVLGTLLQSEQEEGYWRSISESEWWKQELALDSILPSLGLSYQHMNTNLKQCFAYTSIFPRGYEFQKEQLVHMWIAQGFIQFDSDQRTRPEDSGNRMFDELTNRHFFFPTMNNKFVMHDLIRDLAVYVSLDECYVVSEWPAMFPATVRHLTLNTDNLDALKDVPKFQNLRTIIFFRDYDSSELHGILEGILKNLKSLRVLDLSRSGIQVKKLPDTICDLSHLRYLDISCTGIRQIPKQFSRLCHLQVLNLQHCHFRNMPEGMNRLINMRHLYAGAETIALIDGIGRLTDLQELEEFRITRKRGHRIGELKGLRNLRRRLVIQHLESVETREEAMEADLKNKEYLNALFLNRKPDVKGQSDLEEDMFEGLEPHYSLKELTIRHYGGATLPNWLAKKQHLTNLEYVYLSNCGRCASLPPLGQLPFLKVLTINTLPAVKRIGVEFYGDADQVFPSLKELTFTDLKECEEWSHTDGRQFFPRLRLLHIYNCLKLRKVPLHYLSSEVIDLRIIDCGDFGDALLRCLQSLTSLVRLELREYPHRTSVCPSNLRHLESLVLRCSEFSLLTGFRSLTSLKDLQIEECPKLNDFMQTEQPYEDPDLKSLSFFSTDDIPFNNVWITLGTVRSLRRMTFHNCVRLACFKVEQEEWFQKLISLEELSFMACRNLQSLPASLVTFSSIKKLSIGLCPEIKSLPENGLPASLKELRIWGCPLLKERCIKDQGLDWQLIAHIPYICIDDKAVQIL
ncbi:putative disease resistance protein RGA1 [Ananas comosus]|uniref:Putative disease resistance protein RGA1 n=1 Tax=Ananas comosus TaxID=4615 RepID=A0A199W948_ANACO|nr:putative disease resistance protein RGA1 [Ananas comosus]